MASFKFEFLVMPYTLHWCVQQGYINSFQAHLLVFIKNIAKLEKGCILSNRSLAKQFGKSGITIQQNIQKLKERGFIKIEMIGTNRRRIHILYDFNDYMLKAIAPVLMPYLKNKGIDRKAILKSIGVDIKNNIAPHIENNDIERKSLRKKERETKGEAPVSAKPSYFFANKQAGILCNILVKFNRAMGRNAWGIF